MPVLELRGVTRIFGGLTANADVTFAQEPGTILGLIGPNGAGKTTLFNCITGFFPPTRGEILFEGKRIDGLSPDAICLRGLVRTWQKVRPLANMTVLDNVVVGALCRTGSVPEARRIAQAQLELVGLAPRAQRLAGALPIGERKKLEVARVLATQPRLLLLDEVLGGLHGGEREELIQLFFQLRTRGLSLLVIEHDMKAMMRVCDRIVVLSSGEKLAEGAPAEIARNPAVVSAYLGEAVG